MITITLAIVESFGEKRIVHDGSLYFGTVCIDLLGIVSTGIVVVKLFG